MPLAIAAAILGAAAMASQAVPPFGVCAHLGGHEFPDHRAELALMKRAGIAWFRADFTWGYFEPADNQWRFERYDTLVASARQFGIRILPILCYNVDWAFPAHEHLDKWCDFVRTVVSRYRSDITHWEVWNEPNIGFWKPKPNPEEYARLLKATYQAIKQVAPEAQVVYGGTSGVDLRFIRSTLDAGALEFFDVLAVHPYRYPRPPEVAGIYEDLRAAIELTAAAGREKPLWITEFGWPTHINPAAQDPDFLPSLIRYAARARFGERRRLRAAVLLQEGFPGTDARLARAIASRLSTAGWRVDFIRLADLPSLKPDRTQVLILPTGEHYPADYFDDIVRFVRDGGLLVHLGGVPFYYADSFRDGRWQTPIAGEAARQALHVGWKAWWIQQGVPREASDHKVVAPPEAGIKLPGRIRSHRWLTDSQLKRGDKFIPLIAAYRGGELVGYPVALYLYGSDLRGALLSVALPLGVSGVTEQVQALYLPRAFMVSLAAGAECVFWYEFRDGGNDPTYNEHRFGIVRLDLQPKPAYEAYRAMTRALGRARFLRALDVPGARCYLFDAGRTLTAAVWAPSGQATVRLRVSGRNIRAFDYLGREVRPRREGPVIEIVASEAVTYLTGLTSAQPAQ